MNRFLTILACIFLSVIVSNAATLTVTKTADTNDGICDSDCSLREAIDVAASGDTIDFSTLFNTTQFIILNGTELTIGKSVTINGTGADKLNIDAGFTSRVININGIGNIVNINAVKITSGFNSSPTDCTGGGIKIVDATVNIDKSTIDFNFA